MQVDIITVDFCCFFIMVPGQMICKGTILSPIDHTGGKSAKLCIADKLRFVDRDS